MYCRWVDTFLNKNKKPNISNDCKILGTEGVHAPNTIAWLEIGTIRLMKIGKEMPALAWVYNLYLYFNVKVVVQMLF